MKQFVFTAVLIITTILSIAQHNSIKEIQNALQHHPQPDTFRVNRLNELSWYTEVEGAVRDSLNRQALQLARKLGYTFGVIDALRMKAVTAKMNEAPGIAREAVALSKKTGDTLQTAISLRVLGDVLVNTSASGDALKVYQESLKLAPGIKDANVVVRIQMAMGGYYRGVEVNYPKALEWFLLALKTSEQAHADYSVALACRDIGTTYFLIGEQEKALIYLERALQGAKKYNMIEFQQEVYNDIGERHRLMGHYPAALESYQKAAKLTADPFYIEMNESNRADVYERMNNYPMAFDFAFRSRASAEKLGDSIGTSWIDGILARAYLATHRTDSALHFANEGFSYAMKTQSLEYLRDNSEALARAYTNKKDFEKALRYYKIYINARDSMVNNEITNKANLAQFNYDLEKKQAEITVLNKDKQLKEEEVSRQRYLLTGSVIVLTLIMITLILLFRNYTQRKKAYTLLEAQKHEIQVQRDQTGEALADLKLTQKQLVQSEKMASLGELTAGIAHEIQNPLNFVNNFSDVNNELIEELKSHRSKLSSGEQDEILDNIFQNNEKIAHHGKRADGIVKGMLQHSKTPTGVKEATDINALADEYLRLSYHGMRAKDRLFNAEIKTSFDESIGKINIVPQDIGRVILNLYNNAFYAVNERSKKAGAMYKAEVFVSTKKIDNSIELTVRDNGTGIPEKVIDKIFQPFFTTKPTGQGTGLGLSLSYDILKANSGEIKVKSREGEGSEFIINLPVTSSQAVPSRLTEVTV